MITQYQILSADINNSTLTVEFPVYQTTTIDIPRNSQGHILRGAELNSAIQDAVNNIQQPNTSEPDDSARTFITEYDLENLSETPRFNTPVLPPDAIIKN